jgi:tetratricopeptide (TPR) repeat protein
MQPRAPTSSMAASAKGRSAAGSPLAGASGSTSAAAAASAPSPAPTLTSMFLTKKLDPSIATTSVGKISGAAPSVKFNVCVEALVNGCVQTFSQLFTLAHRDPVCVDELSQIMFAIPDGALPWLLDRLSAAELLRRQRAFRSVFTVLSEVSAYFERNGDKDEAARHLHHALDATAESLDVALHGDALDATAALHERLGQYTDSLKFYEQRYRLCDTSPTAAGPALALRNRAAQNIIRLSNLRGGAALQHQRYDEARAFYERSVTVARQVDDTDAEAAAYSALGEVNVVVGDLKKALEYQQRFLALSRLRRDGKGESSAALSVAQLQRSLGDTDASISSFRKALEAADAAQDLNALCSATRQVAEAYRAAGERMLTAHYLQQHFRVARELGVPETVESARVALGFALATHHLENAASRTGFLAMLHQDMPALLTWLGEGTVP